MNINEKQQALIEKYLDNNLSSIQKASFEEELKNERFRKQLLFQAQLIDAHRTTEKEKILGELETFAQATKKMPKNRKYLGFLIGVIAFALIVFAILFMVSGKDQGEALYAEYYVELPADVNTRGTNNNQSELYNSSMQSYVKRDYVSTIAGLEKITPQTSLTKLYIAVCELKTNNFTKAENLLASLIQSEEGNVKENAQYYMALILVRKGEFQQARKLLKPIKEQENHLFKAKAELLLGQIADF